jgi:hypothetical protein
MTTRAIALKLYEIAVLVLLLAVLFTPAQAARDEDPPYDAKLFPEGIAADTTDIADSIAVTTMSFHVGVNTLRIPYFGNRPIEETYADVTRAIVVVHGTLRNADDYFNSIVGAGVMANHADSTTLIIAPQFLTEPDLDAHGLPEDYLYWSYMGWRQGDQSRSSESHPRPVQMSSFALTDSILFWVAQRSPNLAQVVVAGHSAGGQFLNRYAAGTTIHQVLVDQMGIPIRYVVSNPSSYMYFNEERWIEGTAYQFAVPSPETIAQCPTYDDYKYGLNNPNPYMSLGSSVLRDQYSQREVIYLLGGADTDPHSTYLDLDCPAMLQGSQRLERGVVYTNHLIDTFGASIFNLHKLAIAPGIGHNQDLMFKSACGLFYLYDYGTCDPVPPANPWSDATTSLVRAINAHAVALGDFDGDGDRDFYWPVYGGHNRLTRNEGSLAFSDATVTPVDDATNSTSSQWADYDNDGKLDLYLTNWRGQCRLFRNEGGGAFADSTRGALAVTGDVNDCSWADYDNDGDVDLYVTRTNGQSNYLLRNDGANGFVDATTSPLGYTGESRGSIWGDYDNDGDVDLYIAANGGNRLFRNDGTGAFTNVTSGPLGNSGGLGSAAAWGDYDNDGDLDLYLANRNRPNKLLRNDGGGVFTDVTTRPLDDFSQSWSTTWGDYDNDGLLDLFLCNRGSQSRLFRNLGGGQFSDTTDFPLDRTGDAYGAAWDDLDGDGDLDLAIATSSGNVKIARNDLLGSQHWLHLNLTGVYSNRSAIGARVRVVTGGVVRIRQVGGDSGYLAQNSLTVEFGLGAATMADTVEIIWPSGIHQIVPHVAANQVLDVTESSVPAGQGETVATGLRVGPCFPNPIRGSVTIPFEIPSPLPVSLRVYDLAGRVVRVVDADAVRPAGRGSIVWDGRRDSGGRAPSGVYLCRITAGGFGQVLRVVLID